MKFRYARSAGLGLAVAASVAATVVGAPGSPVAPVASAGAGSPAYSLSYQTYPDGQKVVARWNPCQPAVTYKVNPKYAAKTRKGKARAVRDVKGAIARLSSETGISFRYTGRTSRIPKDAGDGWADRMPNAELDIAWVKQSKRKGRTNLLGRAGRGYAAGTGGYSYKFWRVGSQPWQGVSGRGFVVLDAAQNRKFKPGFGSGATRGDLLLHELGHVVGLNHVGSNDEVMYPTIIRRGHAGYNAGDRAGLARLGRAQGCIEVPDWIWKDLS